MMEEINQVFVRISEKKLLNTTDCIKFESFIIPSIQKMKKYRYVSHVGIKSSAFYQQVIKKKTFFMKVHIGVIIALLATAGVIYHITSQGDGYNGYPYLYTCQTGKTPTRFSYGWPVNKTLMLMDDYAAFRIADTAGSNFMCYDLWETIPKHNLTIIDPNIMVAYATDGVEFTHFLLINGTKWPFLGGGNQTSSYGIPSSKIIQTNMAFLNNYPTTYYIPTPH